MHAIFSGKTRGMSRNALGVGCGDGIAAETQLTQGCF